MALRIIEHAGLSDVGRQRGGNEDSFLEAEPVFAVADGMGGARAGEVASRIAVETLADGDPADGSPERRLAEIAQAANRRIYELAQADESRSGMGTTLTAAVLNGSEVAIAHVGDSRLYRLREGELERMTRDHSLVEELVRRGELEPGAAESHPQRSIITRALGPEPDVEVETFTCPARDGDVYLICSDGLTGMVSEDVLAEIVEDGRPLEESARRLVEKANENGGKDNVTVVLFRLGSDDSPPADADTLSGQETRTALSTAEVRTASQKRGGAAAPADQATTVAERPRAAGQAAPRRGRRPRALVTAAIVLVVLVVLVIGFYVGSRQFYFLGTSDQGLVTLYRGVPYELPGGVELYELQYSSGVRSASMDARQREVILNQDLRSRGDAIDLIRQLEDGRLES